MGRVLAAIGLGCVIGLEITTAAMAQEASRPPVLEDESWIVYQGGTVPVGAGGTTPLHLIRADGTGDHLLLADDPRIPETGHPDWSPDGDRIAFDVPAAEPGFPSARLFRRHDIWDIGADGTGLRQVASCELPCLQLAYPAWSPDGSAIAVIRYETRDDLHWGPSGIDLLDMASGQRRVVAETADGTSAFYDPRWSPDGRSIVATLERYTDAQQGTVIGSTIVVVETVGSDLAIPTAITPPDLPAAQPAWGPDGTIAFITARVVGGWPDSASLMLVRPDGTDLRPLFRPVPGKGIAMEPAWTHDGLIAFVTAAAGGERLSTVDAQGGGFERAPCTFQTPAGVIQRTYARLRPIPAPAG
jgi:Tol biopolymer transport system component